MLTLPVIEYKQVTNKLARNPVPLNHDRTHKLSHKPTLIYEINVGHMGALSDRWTIARHMLLINW